MSRLGEEDSAGVEKTKLQVDLYGVKAYLSPSGGDEEDPPSWRDAAKAINANLRTITVGIFRLLKETLRSATRLVRGIGEIPGTLASRIEGAHRKADMLEASRQSSLEGQMFVARPGEKEVALRHIKRILDKKAAEGLAPRVFSDGQRTVICIIRAADEEVLEEIARASLKAGEEQKALAENTVAEE